jgi:hypothetical protein
MARWDGHTEEDKLAAIARKRAKQTVKQHLTAAEKKLSNVSLGGKASSALLAIRDRLASATKEKDILELDAQLEALLLAEMPVEPAKRRSVVGVAVPKPQPKPEPTARPAVVPKYSRPLLQRFYEETHSDDLGNVIGNFDGNPVRAWDRTQPAVRAELDIKVWEWPRKPYRAASHEYVDCLGIIRPLVELAPNRYRGDFIAAPETHASALEAWCGPTNQPQGRKPSVTWTGEPMRLWLALPPKRGAYAWPQEYVRPRAYVRPRPVVEQWPTDYQPHLRTGFWLRPPRPHPQPVPSYRKQSIGTACKETIARISALRAGACCPLPAPAPDTPVLTTQAHAEHITWMFEPVQPRCEPEKVFIPLLELGIKLAAMCYAICNGISFTLTAAMLNTSSWEPENWDCTHYAFAVHCPHTQTTKRAPAPAETGTGALTTTREKEAPIQWLKEVYLQTSTGEAL